MRPIGMAEMASILELVDELGLSREQIVVPLAPAGDGSVERLPDGRIQIEVPASRPLAAWLPELRARLEAL